MTLAGYANDAGLLNPPDGDTEAARTARRRSDRYKETLEAYDKLRVCPCCGSRYWYAPLSLPSGPHWHCLFQ